VLIAVWLISGTTGCPPAPPTLAAGVRNRGLDRPDRDLGSRALSPRRAFFSFLDPWKGPQGAGFQTVAGPDRPRLGRGVRRRPRVTALKKINYLPEAHTDMIMAVIGEELGPRSSASPPVVAAFCRVRLRGATGGTRSARIPSGRRLAGLVSSPSSAGQAV
jgi:hypothetical protein